MKLNAQTESFQFYPNPVIGSQDVVTIQGPDIQTVTIFDIAGKLVKEFKSSEPSNTLDLSVADLHHGSYLLIINHVAANKLTILD